MAGVVYISPVMQLLWAYKNYITNPPTNPDQRPQPPPLSPSHTPNQYLLCSKSPQDKVADNERSVCAQLTNIIQTIHS